MRHALFVAALAAVAATGLQAQDGPYHFSKEISIGGEGVCMTRVKLAGLH